MPDPQQGSNIFTLKISSTLIIADKSIASLQIICEIFASVGTAPLVFTYSFFSSVVIVPFF